MATLEKIRSKSVLLLIIIGAALIAFIIGDFFTSGRTFFGTGTTVAKAGNQKIDIQEFQQRMEQANQQYQQSGQKIDQALLQQQVLNSMIAEKLFQEEMAKLGLKVTDKELSEMMVGANSAYVDQLVRQQFGVNDARTLNDMAFNPAKYGLDQQTAVQLQQMWMGLESQMEQQLLQQKFLTLLDGTITANELDAKALYDENMATSNVAYVLKDFSSLKDEDFNVTSDEIKKDWNEHKKQYAIPEQLRRVSYISVPIEPSKADFTAAEKQVEDALAALNEKPETDGVNDNTLFVVNRVKTTGAGIRDAQIKKFADSTAVGRAELVTRSGNNFTLAKLINKTNEVDSIDVDLFAVMAPRSTADSIVTALNGGTLAFDSLQTISTVAQIQKDQHLSMIDPQMTQMKSRFESQPTGRYFVTDTTAAENIVVARITNRKNPVTVYDLAVITFEAEPSNATINQLTNDLQSFINNNSTAELFMKNAAEANYQTFEDMVSASSPQIGSLPESRNAVSWAMNNKKGMVSPIFGDETTGRLMVVAIDDIYDDYIPARDPQAGGAISRRLKNDKKAEALIDQYKGKAKDLQGYAQVMESRVDTASVNFGQNSMFYPMFSSPEILAYVATAKPGELVGPVKANTGVVVFNVISNDNEGRPYDYAENAAMFSRSRGAQMLSNNLPVVLLGKNKVKNNLLKFFRE
ncbi:MAG: SurA N-terminal domain-containing protein [Paramuribaculum sp.]|nr:SurA N-terminal domain-containing protein [Paramuribaculum sp.]